jgi:magnesium transporter
MAMPHTLTTEILIQMLRAGDERALNAALEDIHPHDIAQAAADLDDESLWTLLQRIRPPLNAEVFSHLSIDRQVQLAESRAPQDAADLLESMPSDDRVDLVQQLDEESREDILGAMEEPQRRDVQRLSLYRQGTVGSVMSSDVATLQADLSVTAALARLREMAAQKETIYYNYVVDADGRLLGIVSLRALILADPAARLRDLMNEEVVALHVDDPVEDAARLIREYDLLALPVITAEGRLAGIVTVDDVLDVAEDEATEDFHKFGATGLGRISLNEATVGLLYRRRIVWLMVLVFVNIFSGAGIAAFEQTIQSVVALVFFLPLLIDSGGNAGSQAATLMVRALATGEVVLKDWARMLGKEFGVALALGATMAAGVSLISAFRAPEVVVVVAPAMVLIVLAGSLIGMLLPFVLTRLRMDPATASGPLITSLADISGVMIYLGLATWLLRGQISAAGGL